MLGLRLVVGNVVLLLRPGGDDALTRWLNEVHRKKKKKKKKHGALRNTYINKVIKLNSKRKQYRSVFHKGVYDII